LFCFGASKKNYLGISDFSATFMDKLKVSDETRQLFTEVGPANQVPD
jgi:hypothetical protein